MNSRTAVKKQCGVLFAVAAALTGCGGGGGSSTTTTPPVTLSVSGTVTAPGGALALRETSVLEKMLATVFGRSAVAALPGTAAVPSASVSLIEVDTSGIQVGTALATATTAADGTFTVEAPSTFEAAAKYVLRVGSGATEMDTIVTSTTDQDIDPATEAATDLILAAAASGSVSLGSIAGIATALTTELQNQEEASNVLDSITADGTLTGTVTDAAAAPLANVDIVVRDFKNWVTRAITKTNAAGQYTVKVPSGSTKNYIIGALNHVSTNMAASEWWTAGGGTSNQYSAGKVAVANTTTVTKDFVLDPGAQIKGVVYATDGTTPLGGVHVLVRDFSNDTPVAISRTRPDGKYLINVPAGTYTVGTRNQTLQAYAGGTYDGPAAGSTTAVTSAAGASAATPIIVAAGDTITAKFALPAGGKVSGVVTDPASGTTPVPGIAVRVYGGDTTNDLAYGRFVEGMRTHNDGSYRIWLQPDDYIVRSRGQTANITAATATPVSQDFADYVGQATAILTTDGTTPLSQVKVQVYDTGSAYDYIGFEASNGDGTVTVYTSTSGSGTYALELKVDSASLTVGSAIYDGTISPTATRLTTVTPIAIVADSVSINDLGTLTMPAGGELKGLVTKDGVAVGNAKVQLRTSGVNGGFRFVNTRTQSDGSYSISVPAAAYNTVCAFVESATNACNSTGTAPTGYFGSASSVAVIAGQSNTLATIDMTTH